MAALIYLIDTLLVPGAACCCGCCCSGRAPTSAIRCRARSCMSTNPVIVPLRRLLPAIGRLDTASCWS